MSICIRSLSLILLIVSIPFLLFTSSFSSKVDEFYRTETIGSDSLYEIYKNWNDYPATERSQG